MSIFSTIKDAIFGKKAAPAPSERPQIPAGHGWRSARRNAATRARARADSRGQAGRCRPDARRHGEAKGNPDLNYKTSIVDLMKLLGLDSSLDNRKELATELGYTGDKDGSAEMNIWLHKEVMRQLAANGGKVPASMTD